MSKPNPFLKSAEPQQEQLKFKPLKRDKSPPSPKDNPFAKKALADARAEAKENHPNPFLRAPKGKGGVKAAGPVKMDEAEWERKRADGLHLIHEAGVGVGDRVTVTWEYDRAFGPGTSSHTGTVKQIEPMLIVEGTAHNSGELRLALTGMKSIKLEKSKSNPFLKT